MIIWEQAPNGHIECIVNDYYGVVGLAHPRTGWSARLDSPCGRQTAPMLFHTAAEAKAWVAGRIEDGCAEPRMQPAPSYSTSSARAAPCNQLARLRSRSNTARRAPLASWAATIGGTARRVVARYQHWNALFLDPRQYGQLPLCYATAQQALLQADQPC